MELEKKGKARISEPAGLNAAAIAKRDAKTLGKQFVGIPDLVGHHGSDNQYWIEKSKYVAEGARDAWHKIGERF